MATMHTTNGLLTYLQQRLDLLGSPHRSALIVMLVLAGVALALVAAGLLLAAPEPIISAPVRWVSTLVDLGGHEVGL
jgi:hypothetical protein